MKSILVFLLAWAASFAALWLGAHQLFYPPGDWIAAALVSFFFALGVGAVTKGAHSAGWYGTGVAGITRVTRLIQCVPARPP